MTKKKGNIYILKFIIVFLLESFIVCLSETEHNFSLNILFTNHMTYGHFCVLAKNNDHFSALPRMEAIIRIANIPLVETGVKTAGKVYSSLKVFMKYSLGNP